MFVYYDTEQALPLDVASLCRKIVARDPSEKEAVLAVLDEFFHETPTGWFHDRCEEEIADYRKKNSQASVAGKASAAARAERRRAALAGESPTGVERRGNENPTDVERTLNGRSTEVQQTVNRTPTNQEPITNNHKPVKQKTSAPPGGDASLFPQVDAQVVADFKALRTRKRAPITATAMSDIAKQASIAGMTLEAAMRVCCSRGWAGFKAEWVADGRDGTAKPSSQHVAGVDHASTVDAMRASVQRHNIDVPDDGEIDFK